MRRRFGGRISKRQSLIEANPSPLRVVRREQGAAKGVGSAETGKHTNRPRYTWNKPCDFLAPSLPSSFCLILQSQVFPSKALLHHQSLLTYSTFFWRPPSFLQEGGNLQPSPTLLLLYHHRVFAAPHQIANLRQSLPTSSPMRQSSTVLCASCSRYNNNGSQRRISRRKSARQRVPETKDPAINDWVG